MTAVLRNAGWMDLPPVEALCATEFRQLVENARDVVLVTEAEPLDEPGPRIVYVNRAFTELTGYTPEEVLGRSPRFLQRPGETDPGTIHEIRQLLESHTDFHGAILNFGKDGTPYWLDIRIFPLTDDEGRITHFAAIERDITARTLAELELRKAALQDPLTGLLNRRGFHHVVARSWGSLDRPSGAVMMVDLDGFKGVNDTAGHPVGDMVLATVGRALMQSKRDGDFAARLGGDEFALVLPGATPDEARRIAERIRRIAAQAMVESGLPVSPTVSIGVATKGSNANLDEMVAAADATLYQAKREGGNRVVMAAE